jgi:hypothetical protein
MTMFQRIHNVQNGNHSFGNKIPPHIGSGKRKKICCMDVGSRPSRFLPDGFGTRDTPSRASAPWGLCVMGNGQWELEVEVEVEVG